MAFNWLVDVPEQTSAYLAGRKVEGIMHRHYGSRR